MKITCMQSLILLSLCGSGCVEQSLANKKRNASHEMEKRVRTGDHVLAGLQLKTLNGKTLTEKDLGGRVLLVVNVASQCGFTSQYADLQGLHEKYVEQGLTVIGVPCNQFGGQEPGAPNDIMDFTKRSFGVTFPLLAKQDVKGPNQSALLSRLIEGSSARTDVRWNFEKFVVDRTGRVVARFGSSTAPSSPQLVAVIEKSLRASR
ncbi:MAG: glutathione peroxidase [Myxococcota bacterium]|nr:glutathione peroxidase [Myxococcota bacterium]